MEKLNLYQVKSVDKMEKQIETNKGDIAKKVSKNEQIDSFAQLNKYDTHEFIKIHIGTYNIWGVVSYKEDSKIWIVGNYQQDTYSSFMSGVLTIDSSLTIDVSKMKDENEEIETNTGNIATNKTGIATNKGNINKKVETIIAGSGIEVTRAGTEVKISSTGGGSDFKLLKHINTGQSSQTWNILSNVESLNVLFYRNGNGNSTGFFIPKDIKRTITYQIMNSDILTIHPNGIFMRDGIDVLIYGKEGGNV